MIGGSTKRGARLGGGSIAARTFLASAAVLIVIFALLLVTPVEVSAPIRVGEAAILLGGLLAMLGLQLFLVRRALAPLRDLAAQMREIDLREPVRLPESANQGDVIGALVESFNTMLERLVNERRQSARAVLNAQEADRLRTARELHDEVGQSLTAVVLGVEQLATTVDPEAREHLAKLSRQLQGSLGDIRRIVRELRPEALDDLGLVNALIALISRVGRHADVHLERRLSARLPPLHPDQELVIYRVAQESLTNVVRHAEATLATVGLEHEAGAVTLTVRDDGRGMPDGGAGEGSGIEGMRERASLIGASLRIESQPMDGTRVRLVLPLEAEG